MPIDHTLTRRTLIGLLSAAGVGVATGCAGPGSTGNRPAPSAATTGAGQLFLGSSTSVRANSVNGSGDVVLFMSPTSPSGFTIAEGLGSIQVTTLNAGGSLSATNTSSGLTLGTAKVGGNTAVSLTAADPQFGGFSAGTLNSGGDAAITATGARVIAHSTMPYAARLAAPAAMPRRHRATM